MEKNGLFFSSWGNERPYAQLPLSKIRFFLSIQQLTLWPSKSENFKKFSKFGATFERVPHHLSNLSGWNYLHFYIKFHIKLRNFTDFNIWPPFWPPTFLLQFWSNCSSGPIVEMAKMEVKCWYQSTFSTESENIYKNWNNFTQICEISG